MNTTWRARALLFRLGEIAQKIDKAIDDVGFGGMLYEQEMRTDLLKLGVQVAELKARAMQRQTEADND